MMYLVIYSESLGFLTAQEPQSQLLCSKLTHALPIPEPACILIFWVKQTIFRKKKTFLTVKASFIWADNALQSSFFWFSTHILINNRARIITKAFSHPGHHVFELLPPGRRYWLLKTRTSRLRDSFYPRTISALNINHKCCYSCTFEHSSTLKLMDYWFTDSYFRQYTFYCCFYCDLMSVLFIIFLYDLQNATPVSLFACLTMTNKGIEFREEFTLFKHKLTLLIRVKSLDFLQNTGFLRFFKAFFWLDEYEKGTPLLLCFL